MVGRSGGVQHLGGRELLVPASLGGPSGPRLDVGRVTGGVAHERVLTDRGRVQELLAARSTHGPGIRLHDDVLESEAGEDALVGVAVLLVRHIQTLVGVVEAVAVLHRELAAPQQPCARTGFVAVLVLDLIDRQRQILVRVVEVLHGEREDFLVRRGEQIVGALAVFQAEDAVAVLLPAPGDLVRFARQQSRKVHLLRAEGSHLLADDVLDLATHLESQRQPGEDTGRLAADVSGAHEQPVAGDLGVGRVLTQRADEQVGQTGGHAASLDRGARIRGSPRLVGQTVLGAAILALAIGCLAERFELIEFLAQRRTLVAGILTI